MRTYAKNCENWSRIDKVIAMKKAFLDHPVYILQNYCDAC